ncbi:MAG: 16S rRNA (cytosine(1402)-N(4))-methyltransferase RsmH [Myxococcales bacterium]|nr:16S rRNA (cytosine(1402)-N(4))-methyltransferase RsmH [Myxococcales bacterium]
MNVVNVMPMSHFSPPRLPSEPHISVLAREVTRALDVATDGTYVDVTTGAGGHTRLLLDAGAERVIGLDRDPAALALARQRLARFGSRASLHHAPFSDLPRVLAALGVDRVQGIVADLGLSSMQLDAGERGMSFRTQGPLDMRMDPTCGETALELIGRVDDEDLTEIIGRLGEERRARRVARCIKQEFAAGRLLDTLDLRRAVVRAVGPARVGGIDPATKTFQALRMAVNAELGELDNLLATAGQLLVPGGVLAIISFHSLEDRMVKRAFADRLAWAPTTKKPVTASEEELAQNPRSRSAKLRVARRLPSLGELS